MKKWWFRKVDKEVLSDESFDNLDEIFNETEVVWRNAELKRSDPQIRAAYQRGYQAGLKRVRNEKASRD